MTLDIPLAFFAESREEAEAQARAWIEHEPAIDLVSGVDPWEVRPGRWDVIITVASKEPLGETIGMFE